MMNRVLLIACTLLAMPVQAAPSTWLQKETANMHKMTGPFVQEDYGFSVEAPSEIPEYVTNGGDANHGVVMILGEQRKIVVYPEYTFTDSGNTKPCRRNQFPWESTSNRTTGSILLGSHTACLVTFTGVDTVWSAAQATGNDRGQGIMYTLLLTTTRQSLQKDLLSLKRVAASFKHVAINP